MLSKDFTYAVPCHNKETETILKYVTSIELQLTWCKYLWPYVFFLNPSSIRRLYSCRLTEDCEQKVRATESLDICSSRFRFSRSEEAVRSQSSRMLCDVLLDQAVMPGVGNIIKNEALFDSGLHPAVKV